MSAVLSKCGSYRYALWRERLNGEGTILFVMLNPSTADAEQDDPTIRRCIGFARRWGYERLAVGNLYGYRATSPKALRVVPYPLAVAEGRLQPGNGSRFIYDNLNDEWLRRLALDARAVICAWGATAGPMAEDRKRQVLDLLHAHFGPVDCLGTTKAGHPRHPLYVRGDSEANDFQLPELRRGQ